MKLYLVGFGRLGLGSSGDFTLRKWDDDGFLTKSILSTSSSDPGLLIFCSTKWKFGHLTGWWDGLLGLEGLVGLSGGLELVVDVSKVVIVSVTTGVSFTLLSESKNILYTRG